MGHLNEIKENTQSNAEEKRAGLSEENQMKKHQEVKNNLASLKQPKNKNKEYNSEKTEQDICLEIKEEKTVKTLNELIIDSHSYDEEKNIDANLTKKQQKVKIKAASAKQPQQTNDNNNRPNDNEKEALIPDLNDDQLKTKSSAQQNMPGKTLENQEQSTEKSEMDLTREQKELKTKSSAQQSKQGITLEKQEQSIEKTEIDLTTEQKELNAKSSVPQYMQGNTLKEQEQSIEKIEMDLTTKQKEAIAKEHEEKKDKSIDNSNQDYTVKCNVVKPSITTSTD